VIVATPYGNAERRLFEASSLIPRPGAPYQVSGTGVDQRELTIAAVASAARLTSETVGGFTLRTYKGDSTDRQPVLDSQQADLFQHPAEGWDSFMVWSDVIAGTDLADDMFLWKVIDKKARPGQPRVLELYPTDPAYYQVKKVPGTGQKQILARMDGTIQDVTANVIHIRSWAAKPTVTGLSTIRLHTRQLRNALSYEDYRGEYFDNDASAGLVITHPGNPNKTVRKDILDGWTRRQAGAGNRHKPGILWGGMTLQPLGVTLKDSQAVELADSIARDVARMFRIYPGALLMHFEKGGLPMTVEAVGDLFWRFSLFGRVRRVERALASDLDLFPDRSLWPAFDPAGLVKGDITTTASVAHSLIQVGVLTPNEARAMMGIPRSLDPRADKLLETPVGAGANTGLSLDTPAPPMPTVVPATRPAAP
jgi:HK97 family phage portal protein